MTYILATDSNARKRLDLQNSLYEDHTLTLFNGLGSLSGKKILEVGCGSGAVTKHLAYLAKPKGRVWAIDIDTNQLKASKALADNAGINNTNFVLHDVNDLTKLNLNFDLIYCRMVLHHLSNAQRAIDEMIKSLTKGGVLIIEEPSIHNGSFCYPYQKSFTRFVEICRQCFYENGRDLDIAYRLGPIFTEKNLSIRKHCLYQPFLQTEEEKLMYVMAIDDLQPQILKNNIATKAELSLLKKAFVDISKSNTAITWVRMHSIVVANEPMKQ